MRKEFELRGVAVDLDGTALRSDHSFSPEMVNLSRDLHRRRIWLTLASARPPRSVQKLARLLHAKGPLVALNGAIVFSETQNILWRRSIPTNVTAQICEMYARQAVSLNIYSAFKWIAKGHDSRVREEASIVGFAPSQLPSIENGWPIADKILLIVDRGDEKRICLELAATSSEINVSVSKPCYVEINHSLVDKGNALSIAAKHANVEMASILAAGDNENDISMLAQCGFSVAMAGSPKSVRRVARTVVGTNDDDSLPSLIRSMLPPVAK